MAAQQQQGQGDNSLGFLWIIIALFAGCIMVWYVWHSVIVNFIFKIKLGEIWFISLFTPKLLPIQQAIYSSSPSSVTLKQLADICNSVGSLLSIPVIILFVIFSILLYRSGVANRYRKIHTMKSLAAQEKENWPFINPVVDQNILEADMDKGPWAMSMTPMYFAKKFKLLKEEKKAADTTLLSKLNRVTVTVKKGKADRAFAQQLGEPWPGVQHLPLYMKALFAIFIAKAEGDRKPANELLRQISASATSHPLKPEKLNFSGAEALLKKHQNSKILKKIYHQHAYTLTVMASMLEVARMDGVLATAEFIWLKPIDRPLWYVLNTVGRQTAPVEVAGPIAHWLAEKEIGRQLTVPMIEEASVALEQAISDVLYMPDEEEEKS